jgi:hypothetical protein
MIRHPIARQELASRIDAQAKGWTAAARKKTEKFRAARKYSEKQGSWSKVKQVYIDLQFGKCAYCERKFGVDEKSRIEHDVEHFRPKSSIKAWPPKGGKLHYEFRTGTASTRGYYLLAYNPLNYMVSCKKCNSPYKSDHFPIAKTRRLNSDDFAKLALEQPLLLYPISDVDEDPEALIAFEGILPVVKAASGHAGHRARVTIDFFALDTREELLRERALILKAIYVAWSDLEHADPLRRRDANQTIHQIDEPKLPHRNCARSFYRLCKDDPVSARDYYRACIEYLDSIGYG